MGAWQAAEAKQKFGKLVETAATDGPQTVMRHAEPVAVVMSMRDYRALRQQADAAFARLLLASPMEPDDIDGHLGLSLGAHG